LTGLRLVNHIGLTVTDLDASADFYRDIVGFREVRRSTTSSKFEWMDVLFRVKGAELQVVVLAGDDMALQLVKHVGTPGEPAKVGHTNAGTLHLCINVDDIDAKREQVLATGKYDPTPIVEQNMPGVRSFYVTDPDGIPVEFLTGPYVAETTSYTD